MNVTDLQQFLRSLAQPLNGAGARKVADDLEKVVQGMEPFREMNMQQFSEFLARADHLVRTGELPAGGRSRGRSGQPRPGSEEQVREATQRVLDLYERAQDPDFNPESARQMVQEMNSLTLNELKLVARELDLNRSYRTKEDALNDIERKITGRRDETERSGTRPQEAGARHGEMRRDEQPRRDEQAPVPTGM